MHINTTIDKIGQLCPDTKMNLEDGDPRTEFDTVRDNLYAACLGIPTWVYLRDLCDARIPDPPILHEDVVFFETEWVNDAWVIVNDEIDIFYPEAWRTIDVGKYRGLAEALLDYYHPEVD